jgi:hypothetical protein
MAKFDSDKITRYCAELPDWQLQQLGRLVASEIRRRKQEWELEQYRREHPGVVPTQVKVRER